MKENTNSDKPVTSQEIRDAASTLVITLVQCASTEVWQLAVVQKQAAGSKMGLINVIRDGFVPHALRVLVSLRYGVCVTLPIEC